MEQNFRYIITGGPGSGKSSLIHTLQLEGYHCFEEVSRQIIREQQAQQGNCVPWRDLFGFARLNQEKMIQQYLNASQAPCFFDRGLPDIPAYFHFKNQALPEAFIHPINDYRYNSTVFICPPWEDIFVNDPERPETFEDSCEIFKHLKKSYQQHGYQTVELPKLDLKSRVSFIKKTSNVPFFLEI